MSVAHRHHDYIPAAGHHWSLPLYDPLTKVMGVDRLRKVWLEHASLQPSHKVLDVGCGTGTFAIQIKRVQVDVVGLDPDPEALQRAREKALRAGGAIRFVLIAWLAASKTFSLVYERRGNCRDSSCGRILPRDDDATKN